MKIAIVRRECSLHCAGAERYCVNLFRQLQNLGHDVSVVAESLDRELQNEVDFLPVKVNHTTSWTKNRSFAENAGTILAKTRFDIAYGLSLAEGLDCFRVTDPLHAHWMNVFYRGRFQNRLQPLNPRHRAVLDLEKAVIQSESVRRVVTQSSLDQRLLAEYYSVEPSRIQRIYNGVDQSSFHPECSTNRDEVRSRLRISATTPVLIFAAMDFRRKRLGAVLRAMARMQNRNAELLVLGKGPAVYYRLLARTLGIANRIHFLGRRHDIHKFYAAGDLFVLPTLYEPFPNVNLEAMACGLPVLTSTANGTADIIEHGVNGYLVEGSESLDEMAGIMDFHFSLPNRIQVTMSQACSRTAGTMSLQSSARRLASVFEEIVREKV